MRWWGRVPSSVRIAGFAVAFVAVHAVLASTNVTDTAHNPAGDVTGVYRFWIEYWQSTGRLVGVDTAWVYPIGALAPMLVADVFGSGPYLVVWLVMVSLLDAVAMGLLYRRRESLAWWWLAFTALLGPVALSRLDGVALPISVIGVLAVAARPRLAAVLFTVAAWVKVWPAALLAALVIAGRRALAAVAAAAFTSAAVIGLALLAGARGTLFSFVSAQATRGLQIEAPAALPWLWSAMLGDRSVRIYYDTAIIAIQVQGTGVSGMVEALTPVLVVGVLAVVGLAVAARVRGADPGLLLALTATGLVGAVIALNKVGSPQYLTWYVAPILLGLLADPARFRIVAAIALVAAALTQWVYPYHYGQLVRTEPLEIAILTARNLLEIAVLGWSLVELARLRAPVPMRVGAPQSALR